MYVFLLPIPIIAFIIGCQITCIDRSNGNIHICSAGCILRLGSVPPARVCKGDTRQSATTIERRTSNARHTVRDRDACQSATTRERRPFNARHTVRDRDACQSATIGERTLSNARYAVRDRDARQSATIIERIISNARHAVRDRDARQFAAIIECILINFIVLSVVVFRQSQFGLIAVICYEIDFFSILIEQISIIRGMQITFAVLIDMFGIITYISIGRRTCCNRESREVANLDQFVTMRERIISNARYAVRDRDARQAGATGERILTNARYAVRDRDARQAGATGERIISNARHAVRNRDARQSATIAERTISNARHAVSDRDACQSATIVERKTSNARYAVRDRDARQLATTRERTVENIPACYRYRFQGCRNIEGGIGYFTGTPAIITLRGCRSARITARSKNVAERILVGIR